MVQELALSRFDLKSLSVVIPAYREAEALDLLLPALKESVAAFAPDAEILIVDALEPIDNTAAVCRTHGVTHLHRRGRNRYGGAIRTGIADARGGRSPL